MARLCVKIELHNQHLQVEQVCRSSRQ